jgi:hypothetical protein
MPVTCPPRFWSVRKCSEPNFHDGNPFEIDSNGNVVANDTDQTDDTLVFSGEEAGYETVLVDKFLDDSLFPQSYLDDWHYWANPLTQSSKFVSFSVFLFLVPVFLDSGF